MLPKRELSPAAEPRYGDSMMLATASTLTTASSPVTVPPTPPNDEAGEGEALMREDLGAFLLSGMSDEAGCASFFDNLFASAPDWASPDDDGCGDMTMS